MAIFLPFIKVLWLSWELAGNPDLQKWNSTTQFHTEGNLGTKAKWFTLMSFIKSVHSKMQMEARFLHSLIDACAYFKHWASISGSLSLCVRVRVTEARRGYQTFCFTVLTLFLWDRVFSSNLELCCWPATLLSSTVHSTGVTGVCKASFPGSLGRLKFKPDCVVGILAHWALTLVPSQVVLSTVY